jgi:hypothetical protein
VNAVLTKPRTGHAAALSYDGLVVVAGGFDARALSTIEWLSRRHGVEVSAFVVSVLRFGGERLLSVRPAGAEAPTDPAAEVQWLLTGASQPAAAAAPAAAPVASTPPPGA